MGAHKGLRPGSGVPPSIRCASGSLGWRLSALLGWGKGVSDSSQPTSGGLGGVSQRRPISQGGSDPFLYGETMRFLWAWTIALWPEAGILRPYPLDMGVENGPLPPLSCQLEEIGSESLLASGVCPGSSSPSVPGTLGKGHPLICCASGQVLTTTCHPFGCLKSKATSRRRGGECVPISGIFSAMPRE